ncbi:BglG family transcription antiterminator [Streptococcus gallolyticus]|uniref:BglG family transcription antiterminator n=1 Tax=Streptococcus hepaticus TaxID=3349163 RepID=UPI001C98AA1E|nr:BglG family transcription antiterminator [Streptococcus gallolyticus]MBY5041524.1 BglG family transcription antiterminator [Streptococcus gallolyticus]
MNTRQINILRELLAANQYVTGQELAARYGISTKTAYADLVVINDELFPFNVEIEKKPRHGIRLELNPEQKRQVLHFLEQNQFEQLDETSQFQRDCELLKKLVLETEGIDILEWSTTHFISEASIRRDFERIEQQLAPYHISLVRRSGQYFLKAKEEAIRKFFRNYLIQHFDLSEQEVREGSLDLFFDREEIVSTIENVSKSSTAYHYRTAEQYSIYLVLDLLISSHRYRKGNLISEATSTIIVEDLPQYEVYVIAGELMSKSVGISMQLIPDVEIRNICYTLLSVGYESQLVVQSDIQQTVNRFIERVERLSGVEFTKDEHLYKMLLNHMQPMIYRLKSGINIRNQITEDIKSRYSVLYYIAWLASKTISEEYDVEMVDAEIAFLTIYLEISVEKLNKPLNIYVICPHGLATSELIMNSLRRTISSFDYLMKIDLKDLTAEKIEQADLIISSIQLDHLAKNYIRVSPIVTDKELEMLQQTYSSLTKGNRNMLSAIHDNDVFSKSVVLDLLNGNILLNQSYKTVEECIEAMVKKTSIKNRKSKKFLQSVLAREKLGSTSVYTGIALPHADPAVVKESELVMMTLEKPIRWGQNLISVVVLIAIAEGDDQIYKNALIGLYSKIDTTAYIDLLSASQTEAEFIDRL